MESSSHTVNVKVPSTSRPSPIVQRMIGLIGPEMVTESSTNKAININQHTQSPVTAMPTQKYVGFSRHG